MAESLEQTIAAYDDTAPVERAQTIPADWYTDPRIAALERRTVWSRTWQLVGRTAQVAAAATVARPRRGELVSPGRAASPLACNWKVFVNTSLAGGSPVPPLTHSLNSVVRYTDYTMERFARFCPRSSPSGGGGDPTTAA